MNKQWLHSTKHCAKNPVIMHYLEKAPT